MENTHYISSEVLTLETLQEIISRNKSISLSEEARINIQKCREYLDKKMVNNDKPIYGINTGFGSLCNVKISNEDLSHLQENLVKSHSCGTGDIVPNEIVKIIKKCNFKNHRVDINSFVDKEDILYTYYDINIINNDNNTIFNLINIINVKNQCFSINNINNYTLGSLDTILYFLYTTYIYNTIYTINTTLSNEKLYYINEYEKYIKDNIHNNILKRLKSNCYGKINYEDEIREIWKKKLTLKYIT